MGAFGSGKPWLWIGGAALGALVAWRVLEPSEVAAAAALRPAPVVAGRALTPDGRPVAGVAVSLRAGARTVAEATSDADGAFRVAAAGTETAAAPWRLRVDPPEGFRAADRSVVLDHAAEQSIVVVVDEEPGLAGRLVDAYGAPLAGVPLEWTSPDGTTLRATTRDDGRFALDAARGAGRWTVRLLDRGEEREVELELTGNRLAPTGGGELALVATAVRHVAVELPGAPPWDVDWRAELFAAADGGWAEPRAAGRLVRGAPDRVVLEPFDDAAGSWVLTLRSDDGLWFATARVEGAALASGEPIVLPVLGRGLLEVTVRGDARGAVVRAAPLDAAAERWLAEGASASAAPPAGIEAAIDGGGHAELGPLAAGAWLAWIGADGEPLAPRRVEVRGGERASVVLERAGAH